MLEREVCFFFYGQYGFVVSVVFNLQNRNGLGYWVLDSVYGFCDLFEVLWDLEFFIWVEDIDYGFIEGLLCQGLK